VANATGLTCQTIKNIEQGKVQPRTATIEKLKKYYAQNKKQKTELAQLRAEKFITITQMAKMLGVSKQYISQVENGMCPVSQTQLKKYKEFYETL
jgi:DNA-binding XRE family transcriptional regulator